MLKSKKLFILLVVVAVVMSIMTVTVSATSGNTLNLDDLLQGGTGTTQEPDDNTNDVANETTEPANTVNETANEAGVVQPITNSDNSESENNLPQTGVTEDITVMFFIVVCAILAIYAYKKIRDYKA